MSSSCGGASLPFFRALLKVHGLRRQGGTGGGLFLGNFAHLTARGRRSQSLSGINGRRSVSSGGSGSRSTTNPAFNFNLLGDVQGVDKAGRLALFALCAGAAGTAVFYFATEVRDKETGKRTIRSSIISAPGAQEQEKRKLTPREKRFIKFASVEYDGQIYMTPQDFLESVVEGEPRPRFKRKRLSQKEVEDMMYKLPRLNRNSEHFFRSLGNQGIISFSEYLFLLTILIKPQSGFKIAFAMLDQDGNERIDKNEFRVLETVFTSAAKERKQTKAGNKAESEADEGKGAEGAEAATAEAKGEPHQQLDSSRVKVLTSGSAAVFDDDEHGLHRAHKVDTTLLIYFFGRRGVDQLRFEDFHKFMDNLQTEVLQMEYQEFSKGSKSITELDFARILLRYTFLNTEEYESILDRLVSRLQDNNVVDVGITFDEFKDFCLFLNNLDDFQIAMRMYTLADKAISEDEFVRAVTICTGRTLSKHLVHTVFQIFDNDGDGLLTYQEFIAMMKDRVNRGLKTFSRQEGWTGFKRCVKQEVRSSAGATA